MCKRIRCRCEDSILINITDWFWKWKLDSAALAVAGPYEHGNVPLQLFLFVWYSHCPSRTPQYCRGSLNSCRILSGNRRACNAGFKLHKDGVVCVPVCKKACINGYCYLPDFCHCLQGYAKAVVSSNVCLPVCPDGCSNGHCVAPGKCVCLPGSYSPPYWVTG
jgi:hypothetical protein